MMKKRPYIGCNYCICNGRLNGFLLCVPFIDSDITALINVHEYTHAIMAYDKLGKKFDVTDDAEVLPMFYEKLFVLEKPSNELIEYKNYLDSCISEDSPLKYRLGLELQDILIEEYEKKKCSTKKLNRKTKRLVRTHKRRQSD